MYPTIKNIQHDPRQDAERLRKAMKGFGTNEGALIDIICKRTSNQRQQICNAYRATFNRELASDIKSEVSGDFERVLLSLLCPAVEYDAQMLRKAISGMGTDEKLLIEILCSRNPTQLRMVGEAYRRMYGNDLVRDVAGDTSGAFGAIMVGLARALMNAGVKQWGTNESIFVNIFTTRNYNQLRMIFDQYQSVARHDIEDAIKREMSGDLKEAFLTLIECVRYPASYFAKRIYDCMKGIGTKDDELIHLIISRAEIDLAQIRQDFRRIYDKSL